MPLSGGTSGAHDDSMHQGSAKRDTINGVAGLNGGGGVVASGDNIALTRSGIENIKIKERTSDESVVYFNRLGATHYVAFLNWMSAWRVVQHDGYKDAANGIAALDAAGALLLPGSKMYFTRDGSDDVHIYERTSDEEAYAFHRVGADDYTFFVKESNVWKRMQTESMKDAANGIAGLDASVEIPVALLKINVVNGIAGLDASGELVESLYAGILKKYIISDNILHTFVDLEIENSTSYVKKKTSTINALYPSPSTLRVKFDLLSDDAGVNVYGKIYKNGAPVGTERVTLSTSPTIYSEDLSFADGDTIELWLKTSNVATSARTTDLWVYGDETDYPIAEAIIASAIGLADPFAATNSTP